MISYKEKRSIDRCEGLPEPNGLGLPRLLHDLHNWPDERCLGRGRVQYFHEFLPDKIKGGKIVFNEQVNAPPGKPIRHSLRLNWQCAQPLQVNQAFYIPVLVHKHITLVEVGKLQ